MVWLIGASGMLGTEVQEQLTQNGIKFVGTNSSVDITNFDILQSFVEKTQQKDKINIIINCSAYTNVNKAETETALCNAINIDGVRNIAKIAKKIDAILIHVSTDYVFNGKATAPYGEDDEKCPLGAYGKSKSLGEDAIFKETKRAYVIRTAWLYGKAGGNFVFTMMRLMQEKPQIKVVSDQFGTPTYAKDLARAILTFVKLCKAQNLPDFGFYHFTNEGKTSWHLFAKEIYNLAKNANLIKRADNTDCEVLPCTTDEYPTPAERPQYSVLSKQKMQSVLDWTIPEWKESLQNFIQSLKTQGFINA